MEDISTAWSPSNGFDHVSFQIYLNDPAAEGKAILPRQQASAPDDLGDWNYMAFAFGWGSNIFSSKQASANSFGDSVGVPEISVSTLRNEVTITIFADTVGNPLTFSGWILYLNTFDYDGIGANFRLVRPFPREKTHSFYSDREDLFNADGDYTGPLIMDWVDPLTISY